MSHETTLDSLAGRLEAATGVKLSRCYRCGKCAAGCPVAGDMDLPPCQIFHLLHLALPGMEERVLRSEAIWICLACATCSTRCPQEVEIPAIMDFLRGESLRLGLTHPRSRDTLAFHRAFLDSIRHTGRLNEMGLVANYKLRTGHVLKDVLLAPKMFIKGKLGLKLHRVKDRRGMRSLFQRAMGKG